MNFIYHKQLDKRRLRNILAISMLICLWEPYSIWHL